ncbi:MAG: ATP-dependent helicase [Candidatus Contendobacter sp.]
MAWDTGLLGTARDIAASDDSPIRVMAGPGTGKSFALKRRVARLLEDGIPPERVLAVTFTRNAAAALVDDLRGLGIEGCDRIRVGTLHAYCYSVLMKRDVLDFLGRYPRPLLFFNRSGVMQFEGSPFLADVCLETDYGSKRDATKAVRAFEAAWARLQTDDPGWALEPRDQAFHDAIISWLKFHNAILIGELIPLVLQYLRDNPACGERHAFDHVLVDEFQDLNKAEQVLIDILAESSAKLLVGDADQSIYSFRYAHPEGIVIYPSTHPGTHDETLADCRRCPQRVVALADHLIRRNYPAGEPPRLRPFEGNPPGEVSVVQWPTLAEEAQGIADFCHHLVNARGFRPQDILVLSPRRLIGYAIRDAIQRIGVAAHSFYYEEALEPIEAQTSLALLTLCCNNEDRVSLRFWVGLGSPTTWNARGYAALRQHCVASGQSPFAALGDLADGTLSLSHTTELVNRFRLLRSELAELAPLAGYALLDRLFPDGNEWSQAVREAALSKLSNETTREEILDLLKTQITQPEMPEEGLCVRVMSLHKSKGLTARAVIVAGSIEGLMPIHDPDLPPADQVNLLSEQRRLFYVATTRCTDILVLSSVLRLEKSVAYRIGAIVRGRGIVESTIASRFISELGPTAPRSVLGATWVASGFT